MTLSVFFSGPDIGNFAQHAHELFCYVRTTKEKGAHGGRGGEGAKEKCS
jgi:hypothetical protein